VEAELFECFKAVNDAATTAAAPTSGPPSSMAKTPSRLKQTSEMVISAPAAFILEDVSMMVGQARPPNSSDVVSLFGSQPISSTFLPSWASMQDRFASVKDLPMPPLP
jgi:hypothetical protein